MILSHPYDYQLHFARHFARQAVAPTVREKKRSNSPVTIAPTILVATNGIAKRTTDKSIVPRIPISKTESVGQIHLPVPSLSATAVVARTTAR